MMPCENFEELIGKELDIIAKVHRGKRSLNANAYFHTLVGLIADKQVISKSRIKNMLIAQYGQSELVGDEPMVYKTNAPEDWMMEREEIHSKLIKTIIEQGKEVNFYRIYRGSHTYDTKEMSILIEGTVQEAKDLGIETLPPAEIKRMVEQWKA